MTAAEMKKITVKSNRRGKVIYIYIYVCSGNLQREWGNKGCRRKPSSSHTIFILTNISTQFLLQSVYACVCVCARVCVCICSAFFIFIFYHLFYNTLCKLFW